MNAALRVLKSKQRWNTTSDSQPVKSKYTWALRDEGTVRRWGGLNLFLAGDMWQFRPINATAMFDSPFKRNVSSAVESMMATFWTQSEDSIN